MLLDTSQCKITSDTIETLGKCKQNITDYKKY